jgi:hypothetical protein
MSDDVGTIAIIRRKTDGACKNIGQIHRPVEQDRRGGGLAQRGTGGIARVFFNSSQMPVPDEVLRRIVRVRLQ